MPDRPAERVAGALVLLSLAGIAATLVIRQLNHEPSASSHAPPQVSGAEASAPLAALDGLVPGWRPDGPGERFGPDRLYEKINGQADLYLQAGFRQLEARRFLDPDDPSRSIELRAYAMETPAAAASVHARQRRPNGERIDPALDAECSRGSCFLSHGPWYLEALPAPPSPEVAERCRDAVIAFAQAHPIQAQDTLDPNAGFPPDDLEEGSVATGVQDAYGLGALDDVATATYRGSSAPLLAWRAETASATEAEALAQRVQDELIHLGARAVEAPDGVRLLEIIGSACALRVTGSTVLGVQEAPDSASALDLLDRLSHQEDAP